MVVNIVLEIPPRSVVGIAVTTTARRALESGLGQRECGRAQCSEAVGMLTGVTADIIRQPERQLGSNGRQEISHFTHGVPQTPLMLDDDPR